MKTWQRDFDPSLELVHEIVVNQFPGFANQTPQWLGAGWDNVCVLYEDDTVFRLPSREMGGKLVQREIAALPKLKGRLPRPIPELTQVGKPTSACPYEFIGYPMLHGSPCETVVLTHQERLLAAPVLGEFLRAIHSISIDEFGDELPRSVHDSAHIEQGMKTVTMRRDFVRDNYPEQADWADHLHDLAVHLRERQIGEQRLALIHGDLYARHILVDDNHEVSGIIDWGDVRIAHPGLDLSLAYTFFDVNERDAFWQTYSLPVTEETLAVAQTKAVIYALALFAYGRDIDNPSITKLGEEIGSRILGR